MALGKRKPKQASLWADARHRQAHPAHPFYRRLNEISERAQFARYVERLGRKYYAPVMGRPSIAPGVYFRCFLVGYFEGIVSARGKDNIAKRLLVHAAAFHLSLILRQVLGVGTARQAADLLAALCFCVLPLMDTANRRPLVVGTPWPTARTARPPRCHHQSPRRHDVALSTGC